MTPFIGYDLDGVLCPDIDLNRLNQECSLPTVIQARQALIPMFRPEPPFVVITGRPGADKELTAEWLRHYFRDVDYQLFHNRGGSMSKAESADFKSGLIISLGLTLFIESDEEIARLMRQQAYPHNVKVLTLADLITCGLTPNNPIMQDHLNYKD